MADCPYPLTYKSPDKWSTMKEMADYRAWKRRSAGREYRRMGAAPAREGPDFGRTTGNQDVLRMRSGCVTCDTRQHKRGVWDTFVNFGAFINFGAGKNLVSNVTSVDRDSTFALRRCTLDFCLGG